MNADGEAVYGATTSYLGRAIDRAIVMRSANGEKLVSSKQIVLPASAILRENSWIYLPGETSSANTGWPVAALALRIGEAGSSDHWKIWLGGVEKDSARY